MHSERTTNILFKTNREKKIKRSDQIKNQDEKIWVLGTNLNADMKQDLNKKEMHSKSEEC